MTKALIIALFLAAAALGVAAGLAYSVPTDERGWMD